MVEHENPETLASETLALSGAPPEVVANRYALLKYLGGGAFGDVHQAHDRLLDRLVALKMVPVGKTPDTGDTWAERVLAEARTVAKLDHPHIVPIYDAGLADDRVWMVSKLVSGQSLAQLVERDGPFSPERTLRVLRRVATALDHAHRQGIIHRDVKPSNILVEEGVAEEAFLADFGIAKVVTGETADFEREVVGTPNYMAPEQITGKRVDARADIFALGCVAIKLLTGKPAFQADTVTAVAYKIVHEAPDGLEEIASKLGDDWTQTLERWVRKSNEDRSPSMAEVLRDLEALETGAPPRRGYARWIRSLIPQRGERVPVHWDGRNVITTNSLVKSYGKRNRVLGGVSLEIPTGSVYALLGRNGSGKTTLIRTILGFYRPERGSARLFGRDPWRQGPQVLHRVGFVPDSLQAYEWMRVQDLLRLLRPFYPGWNQSYCYRILERFDVPLESRIRSLSKGMQTKVSLIAALATRPELLVLDDPTLGLDAVVLEELMETLEETARREGTTILIASHEYEQVERIATHVGLLRDGKLLVSETLEQLKSRAREVEVTFPDEIPELPRTDSFRVVRSSGRRLNAILLDAESDVVARLKALGAQDLKLSELSLRQIFVSYLR